MYFANFHVHLRLGKLGYGGWFVMGRYTVFLNYKLISNVRIATSCRELFEALNTLLNSLTILPGPREYGESFSLHIIKNK